MKKCVVSFMCGVLSTMLLTGGIVAFAGGVWKTINVLENDIAVVVDGKQIHESNFVYDDRTYLPLRAVAEAVGKEVTYDENTNTAYIGAVPTQATTSIYYDGFDVNIPDYAAVTGVQLKKRYDFDTGTEIFYQHSSVEEVFEYEKALREAGFVYLGTEEGYIFYYNSKYTVAIDPFSDVPGYENDLEINIIKNS